MKDVIIGGYTPPVASQFYVTDTLKKIGGYNESITSGVDHDLWLRLSFEEVFIRSVSKALAYPNRNAELNNERMTSNYDKRISGILLSLQIWENDIVKHYGLDFFEHFSKSYMHYLHKGFFLRSMTKYSFIDALKYFFKMPLKSEFIKEVYRSKFTNSKKRLDSTILKPTFLPYNPK